MIKRVLPCAILVAIFLNSGSVEAFSLSKGRVGSGRVETRELNLKEFNAIEMEGSFDLEIRLGDQQEVFATIDDNLWELFEAKVQGHWLNLDWGRQCQPNGKCKVVIVVRELQEVHISGAGDVEIIKFQGHEFKYRLSGAGDLKMSGQVDKLDIRISGAGEADTRELQADSVKVQISGAGNAEVYAKKSIRGRVSGVGNLTFYGDPDDEDTQVSGLGRIRRQ